MGILTWDGDSETKQYSLEYIYFGAGVCNAANMLGGRNYVKIGECKGYMATSCLETNPDVVHIKYVNNCDEKKEIRAFRNVERESCILDQMTNNYIRFNWNQDA